MSGSRKKQEWEGVVIEIEGSQFYANLTRMDTPEYETLELKIPLKSVIKKDRKLIKLGTFINVVLVENNQRYILHKKIRVQKGKNAWKDFDIF